MDQQPVRKRVGEAPEETPLQRAFRVRCMLLQLRGERETDDKHIRRRVGRTKQGQG